MLPRNRLFRLLTVNGLLGAALGLAFVAGLLILDTAGLRRLILTDAEGHVALGLLTAGFVVTCASVMMGSAVMRAFEEERRRPPGGTLAPAAVPARRRG